MTISAHRQPWKVFDVFPEPEVAQNQWRFIREEKGKDGPEFVDVTRGFMTGWQLATREKSHGTTLLLDDPLNLVSRLLFRSCIAELEMRIVMLSLAGIQAVSS